MAVSELVDRRRAVGRTDRQPAEGLLQGFQQLLAQLTPSGDRQFRSVQDVWDAGKSAISLCRKSRMKNEGDRRTRPNSSRLLTEPGRPLIQLALTLRRHSGERVQPMQRRTSPALPPR